MDSVTPIMKQLTKKEEEYLDDLEKNFDKYVERYKRECEKKLKEGKRKELEDELKRLISHLEGVNQYCLCGKAGHELPPPVDDTEISVKFYSAKINVIKSLLKQRVLKDM